MRFGAKLLDKELTLVFGNGVSALNCTVVMLDDDFIVVRGKPTGTIDECLYHVPVSSIVYVRIND